MPARRPPESSTRVECSEIDVAQMHLGALPSRRHQSSHLPEVFMAARKKSRSRGTASGADVFAIASAARESLSDLREAKREWSQRLLAPSGVDIASAAAATSARRVPAAASASPQHNVVGVGVAEKIVEGQPTGLLCVKFFVRVKF